MSAAMKWVLAATGVALIGLWVQFRLYRGLREGAQRVGPPAELSPAPNAATANTNPVPLDLARFINAQLDVQWNTTTYPGDDLAELPRGVQEFDGVAFDIRGVIQLQSQVWKQRKCPFPEKVEGIPIQRACRFLYLLHADGGSQAPTGTPVALLLLHYQDGTQAEIAILHDTSHAPCRMRIACFLQSSLPGILRA